MYTTTTTYFNVTLHGVLTRPVTLMIGSWDPLLPNHDKVLRRMSHHARTQGLDSVAVLLDPPPAKFLPGQWAWPYYNDHEVKIARLLASGVTAVLHIHFQPENLSLGATELFDAMVSVMPIAQVWVGARQTLGRGNSGDQTRLMQLAKEHSFKVRRLASLDDPLNLSREVRTLLSQGRIESARKVVGRAPTCVCPPQGTPTTVAWGHGTYQVLPLATIDAPLQGTPIALEMVSTEVGFATFEWNHPTTPYLAFVAGPRA